MTHLTHLVVETHLEMEVLDGLALWMLFGGDAEIFKLDETSDGSTAIEAFRDLPWQAFRLQLPLQVACSEVDAERDLIIIAMGKACGDAAAEARDAHHHFGLVFDLMAEFGHEEWPALLADGGVGLEEKGGIALDAVHFAYAVVQFLVMFGIVHANADDLHSLMFWFWGQS